MCWDKRAAVLLLRKQLFSQILITPHCGVWIFKVGAIARRQTLRQVLWHLFTGATVITATFPEIFYWICKGNEAENAAHRNTFHWAESAVKVKDAHLFCLFLIHVLWFFFFFFFFFNFEYLKKLPLHFVSTKTICPPWEHRNIKQTVLPPESLRNKMNTQHDECVLYDSKYWGLNKWYWL